MGLILIWKGSFHRIQGSFIEYRALFIKYRAFSNRVQGSF